MEPEFEGKPSARVWIWCTAVVVGAGLGVGAWLITATWPDPLAVLGMDLHLYLDRTRSWSAGNGFYLERQLVGTYTIAHGDAMYPPIALLLFIPFLSLPTFLWWVVPLGMLAGALRRLRPDPRLWPVIALTLVYPRTWVVLLLGNPSMWAIAAGVAGVAWGWPSLAAVIKPAFIPCALAGARHRSWWMALVGLIAASACFGSMWLDWLRAISNARGATIEYVAGEWPIAVALLLAAASGRGQTGKRTSSVAAMHSSDPDLGKPPESDDAALTRNLDRQESANR